MTHWQLFVILYERDGRFEAEAINAGIAGVGKSAFEAMASFEKMALSLAATSAHSNARLTFEPDEDELVLFQRIESGKVDQAELAKLGVIGIGTLGMVHQKLDKPLRRQDAHETRLDRANVELVGGRP